MSYVEYNYDPTVSAVSVLLMLATIFIMFIVEKTCGYFCPCQVKGEGYVIC